MPRSLVRKRPGPLSIRLTPAERLSLQRQAGDKPLSTYVKGILLHGEQLSFDGSHPQMSRAQLARALAALGTSQLAASLERLSYAAANGSLYVDEETVQQLHHAFNEIAEIHYCLLTALGKRPAKRIVLRRPLSPRFAQAAHESGSET